jgi:hypothetical protein
MHQWKRAFQTRIISRIPTESSLTLTRDLVEWSNFFDIMGQLRRGDSVSEPKQRAVQKAEDFLTPASFIRAAQAAHPAFRYTIVTAGLLAIVVTFVKFRVGPATLVFGAIAIIGLMVLFLLFAQASKLTKSRLDRPAQVLVWTILVVAIAIILLLTGSVFFNAPLPFRDWIAQQLAKMPDIPAVVVPNNPDSGVVAEKSVILSELTDAYKATGWKLAFFDSWGQGPTRQLLRVNQGMLIATAVDKSRTVTLSVDPQQLPVPQHYNAYVGQISRLGDKEAPAVVRFFTAYEQFRGALVSLTSTPTDFNGAFINANVDAREAVVRGRQALCAMGSTPPRLFPDGGFPEPVPPNCSDNPFSPHQ